MQFKAISKRKFLLLGGDILIILLATLLAFLIRTGQALNFLDVHTGAILINLFVFPIVFYIADLYNLQQKFRSFRGITKIIASVFVGVIITSVLFYALPPYRFGRGVFLIETIIFTLFIYLWRAFWDDYSGTTLKPMRVLLMGRGWVSENLYEVLQGNPDYRVIGLINGDTPLTGNPYPTALPVFNLENVEEKIREGELDGIVIDLVEEKSAEFWQSLLRFKMSGIDIIGAVALYQDLTGKIPIYHVNDRWFVDAPGYMLLRSSFIQRAKRLFDLGIALLLLPLTLPLMGLIALVVKLTSSGPILYRQRRVGLDEEEFELIKFRTMVHHAEGETGVVWAEKNDRRVTRVGKILRITRLDELPQLFNVLKEEMSFIGPRPERPEFVKDLKEKIPHYSLRHSIKPGITGWAQINYPYGASMEDAIEKLQYDLFYIQNVSFFLEIRIILKTIHVILLGKGSR
jgi:sugar transferase (PEP-CTERM system associated)